MPDSTLSQMTPEETAYEMPEMWIESWFTPDDEERVRLIGELIPSEVRSVLDAGCGNGIFLHYLRDNLSRLERLCGVERSKNALAHVKTEKYRASLESMPFADDEFDLVTSLEVFEHLPTSIFKESLKETCRVSNRFIIITVPYAQDLAVGMSVCPKCLCRFNSDYHVRSFTEENLRPLLNEFNFECREIFHLRPRRVMHRPVARAVDLVRLTKHRVSGYSRAYPSHAVCPACGFRDTSKSIAAKKTSASSPMTNLFEWLKWKRSYRWIGALYECAESA